MNTHVVFKYANWKTCEIAIKHTQNQRDSCQKQ